MKLIPFSLIIALTISCIANAQNRPACGFADAMKHHFTEHPEDLGTYRITRSNIDLAVRNETASRAKMVYNIPVVVHVVYSHESVDISEAQIHSQIEVLNEDFRKLNADVANTPAAFAGLTADVEFEFCLARFDPNGIWTNGITRTETTVTQFNQNTAIMSTPSGGKDAWNKDEYLNIWVTNLNSNILGFAYPIGSQFEGVVVDYKKFGRGNQFNLDSPYNKGRTTTHEIGHYFDLLHPWADNTDCAMDDGIADTPEQQGPNFGCPNHPAVSCGNGGDMFMNFMDYVDDACMVMFSEDQKTRMRAAVEGPGSTLIDEVAPCDFTSVSEFELSHTINIFPNPNNGHFALEVSAGIEVMEINVFGAMGQKVFSSTGNGSLKTIDLSQLTPGLYTIWLGTTEGPALKKLLIQ
jgi:hypothetical protein